MRVHLPLLREAGHRQLPAAVSGQVPCLPHSLLSPLAEQHTPLQPITCGTCCPSRWRGLGSGATQREKVPQLASPRQPVTGASGCPQACLLASASTAISLMTLFSFPLLLAGRLFPGAMKVCLLSLFLLVSLGPSPILFPAPILGSVHIFHPAYFYFYYWKGKRNYVLPTGSSSAGTRHCVDWCNVTKEEIIKRTRLIF